MNTHTPPPPNDDMPSDGTPNDGTPNDGTLTPEERELAALYRRLPQDEPPPALDAAILAQARQAVQPQRTRNRRGAQRWVLGLGSAAALVLAAGVGWHVYSLDRGPAGVSAAKSAADQSTSAPVAPHADATLQSARSANVTDSTSGTPAARVAIAAAAPMPPPPPVVAKPAPPRVVAQSSQRRMAPPPPPPVIEEVQVMAASVPTPPAPPPPRTPPPAIVVVPMAAPAPPAPAPPPPPMQAAPAPPPALQAGLAPFASEAAPPDSTTAAIKHIRELLKANQRAQALAALRDFTRAHPDYVLPDDLKALAESTPAGH